MAVYERFAVHRKVAAPIASEHHTIIEDCHGVLYNNSTNVAADEYYGRWPHKMITTTTRPPLPPPFHQGQHFYPQTKIHGMANYNEAHHDQQSQTPMQRPVNNVHRKKGTAILTSTEAAKLYGGVVITEFGTRKHGRPN
ncbi:hypothetical protein D8674_009618 [Pyrus ussuriensis x Pyrus communis]|uniref:Uncharacterized protein n=1 Tax=Pyrus ussuriensis x Pyrus communis TaxID=2448454 RepID=A0A5N5F8R6_9ROSA|nr:hypothetical protein D8674_009618 [Pyrus ussuriensis x Pyrus communis]